MQYPKAPVFHFMPYSCSSACALRNLQFYELVDIFWLDARAHPGMQVVLWSYPGVDDVLNTGRSLPIGSIQRNYLNAMSRMDRNHGPSCLLVGYSINWEHNILSAIHPSNVRTRKTCILTTLCSSRFFSLELQFTDFMSILSPNTQAHVSGALHGYHLRTTLR